MPLAICGLVKPKELNRSAPSLISIIEIIIVGERQFGHGDRRRGEAAALKHLQDTVQRLAQLGGRGIAVSDVLAPRLDNGPDVGPK